MIHARRSLPPDVRGDLPGSASRALAARLARVESRNVTFLSDDFPIFWDRAEGSNVWDADGNRLVDLTAGFGVAAVGHRHPAVEEAVRAQAGRLMHGMGDVHPPTAKVALLEKLVELAPQADARAVLATSGSEAVEVALKTAHLRTGKPGVVAYTGAYHGLTYGALSVTDGAYFRAPFERQLNPFVLRAAFPNPFRPPEALRAEGEDAAARTPAELSETAVRQLEQLLESDAGARVGAVIVEPIQGRGGEVVPPPGFLPGVAAACRARGVLLILDEVLTGFGRTGRRFACEEEGVVPDLLCVGKALSGGMPISACLGSAEVMEAWPPSRGEAMHTSTFLGHPVACAAALAALETIEGEGLVARAAEEGARWREALSDRLGRRPEIGDVRGRGLLVGIELVREGGGRHPDPERAIRAVTACLRRGWIVLAGGTSGNVLSLTPALNLERELLEEAVEALEAALEAAAG